MTNSITITGELYSSKNSSMIIETEREVQVYLVKRLRQLKFLVFQTSNRSKTANTAGTPDVFAWDKRFDSWVAFECKSSSGELTLEQELLRDCGATVIIRSKNEVDAWLGVSII